MLELTESNFSKETKDKTIVIDFWAEWCGPCKAMAPVFEELSKELKNVTFAKVNVDNNQEIASKFNVMGIPTFIILKNGKEVDRIVGSNPKSVLKSKIEAVSKK